MSKYKKIVILTGVFLMTLSIAACGKVKDSETANVDEPVTNQQESNVQIFESVNSETKEDETVNVDEPVTNQQESGTQITENINPETFPVGEYHDDMGSQLIISKVDDKNYSVDFGIYKSFYVEDAIGSYDANSGVLSFSGIELGTDIIGSGIKLSADVTIQGDDLIVTLTYSEYPYWPVGTSFEFELDEP